MTQPIRSDKVKAERVRYLWGNRLPIGMISVVAGRPDQGKGLFAAHIAADASRRGIKVIYSAVEDSHGLMTRPRLEAAGADLTNILLWRFLLPNQQEELEQLVVKYKIGLIVIDPLAAHLGRGVSRHSDSIRTVLAPLTRLIEDNDTTVLVIEHALKRVPKNGHILNVIGGSGSGLPAATRAAFVFGVDPGDEDRRILAPAKFNIGPKPLAISFEIDTIEHPVVGQVPFLLASDELQAFDPMRMFDAPFKGTVGRPPDKRAAACEWLTSYLAVAGAPVLSKKVFEDAKQYGMSSMTLRRAADDMKIVKSGGGGSKVTWALNEKVRKLMGLVSEDEEAKIVAPAPPVTDSWDAALANLTGDGDGS